MACAINSLGGVGYGSSCTGNGGQPEFWCADFAKWVWSNAGVTDTAGLTPAARSFYSYGVNHGTLSNTPAMGDAVVFSNGPNDTSNGANGINHVALVSQVNSNGTIETISGDWNGQSGTEAHFASTSHVILNTPAYGSGVGSFSSVMGMWIEGYISAPGVSSVGGHAPAVVVVDSKIQVFAVGANRDLVTAWQSTPGGAIGQWQDLGEQITGDPAVAVVGSKIQVFAVGVGGDLITRWQSAVGGSFDGRADLGGNLTGSPAVAVVNNTMQVFAIASGQLVTKWQSGPGGPFGNWSILGGQLAP